MQVQKTVEITPNLTVFATGVHLQAIEVEINGQKQWRWIAVGFEEDSYFNGETVDIHPYANAFEELFILE